MSAGSALPSSGRWGRVPSAGLRTRTSWASGIVGALLGIGLSPGARRVEAGASTVDGARGGAFAASRSCSLVACRSTAVETAPSELSNAAGGRLPTRARPAAGSTALTSGLGGAGRSSIGAPGSAPPPCGSTTSAVSPSPSLPSPRGGGESDVWLSESASSAARSSSVSPGRGAAAVSSLGGASAVTGAGAASLSSLASSRGGGEFSLGLRVSIRSATAALPAVDCSPSNMRACNGNAASRRGASAARARAFSSISCSTDGVRPPPPDPIEALDQSLPQRVDDRLGAVTQVQPAGHVVDDVFDRALGVEQAAANFGGVQSIREQLEDLDLPVGQHGKAQPARVQDLALESTDLVEQPAQQVR